jgi:hypothetical protein
MDVIQQVNSNANKALLWSLLTEERVFAGLSDSSLQPVMTLFETAIHTTINSYAQDSSALFEKQNSSPQMILSTLNKEVIKRVITEMAQYKPPPPPSQPPLVPISTDIQEARIRDITSKVKVLEDDMNSLLVLKKPPEIDFSDKKINDDVPIGENMDELIKQALASRERELELIQFDIPSPTSATTSSSKLTAPSPSQNSNRKSVSFDTDNNNYTDADMEIGTIFNKLKRPIATDAPVNTINASASVNDDKLDSILKSIQSLYEIVNGIAKDVQYIKEKYTA